MISQSASVVEIPAIGPDSAHNPQERHLPHQVEVSHPGTEDSMDPAHPLKTKEGKASPQPGAEVEEARDLDTIVTRTW